MLRNDEINAIYLVHFEKNVINFFTLGNLHSTIDNLIIKWDSPNAIAANNMATLQLIVESNIDALNVSQTMNQDNVPGKHVKEAHNAVIVN